ncbi:Carbohydrate acetyl esterase/feruloyl esterase precursor [Flavobacterium anhuiense]|uniref:Carbohydrate acetyl esterase/feruloyl esterase n=1 Tax=Flavobacterium anhuiense TaxID=459526 RepID=A0AAC9D435_9FLAO|nr:alpha/beta hydrolase-fold protein [Flavobacterium anhuiense]AOC96219.1 Carbohydrate acetyl esterase/feruloyl esterase precursor [Flavobacterium anhuiense]
MRLSINAVIAIFSLYFQSVNAQSEQIITEDFKPSAANQPERIFPQVNSQRRVRASISAPNASKVQLDIGGVKYDMRKDDKGVWTGESNPQDEGFHYYQLNIDGASVPDPGSLYFYGAGRLGSGIEIPSSDQDFFALKNVPHGLVSENIYFSKLTNSFRRCFIYTPEGYNENTKTRYPVLYLQHGSFEDETGWSAQGKANLILDNLIASKKAVPMIIVMDNGYAYKAQESNSSDKNPKESVFEDVLITEVIPMIDAKFRTIPKRENRAIAGLSMGANQTMRIMMNHLDTFAYYGGFSGTANYPSSDAIDASTFLNGKYKDGNALNKQIKLFWLGLGTKEPAPFPKSVGAFRTMLEQQGIKYDYYESPETAHEWLTWRRCLHQFASKLFK